MAGCVQRAIGPSQGQWYSYCPPVGCLSVGQTPSAAGSHLRRGYPGCEGCPAPQQLICGAASEIYSCSFRNSPVSIPGQPPERSIYQGKNCLLHRLNAAAKTLLRQLKYCINCTWALSTVKGLFFARKNGKNWRNYSSVWPNPAGPVICGVFFPQMTRCGC